jgi:hypothetical protein
MLNFPSSSGTVTNEVPGFNDRVASRYYFPESEESIPRSCPSPGSSMNMAETSYAAPSTRSITSVPSLASSRSTYQSASLQSYEARSAVKETFFDEDGNILVDRRSVDSTFAEQSLAVQPLRCLFSDLACGRTFSDVSSCISHSKTHFRGQSPLRQLACAFAHCDWKVDSGSGEEAWSERSVHLACDHDMFAECHRPWKKDMELYRHLWQLDLVSNAQFQELRAFGKLETESSACISTQSASRDRRRGGRPPRTGVRER